MKKHLTVLMLTTTVLLFVTNTCSALAPFKKAFDEAYVKSTDDAAFQSRFRKANCYTCHIKGKKKDWLNGYGLALARHIPGNAKDRLAEAKAAGADARKAENQKLLGELKKAFEKAESAKSVSGDSFGALFEEHQLPSADAAKSIRDADSPPADSDENQ